MAFGPQRPISELPQSDIEFWAKVLEIPIDIPFALAEHVELRLRDPHYIALAYEKLVTRGMRLPRK